MFTLRLASIGVADVPVSGEMAATADLEVLGKTYQDTCKLTQEDPELTEHYSEENDDPEIIAGVKGKTTLAFSIMNPDLAVLQKTLGGTLTGVAPNQVWKAPSSYTTIEKSVRVTAKQGLIIDIPRGQLLGKINGDYSKKGIFLIDVVVTALKPADEDFEAVMARTTAPA